MTQLKDLFAERDATYKKQSKKILKMMSNVIEGATSFVYEREGRNGTVEWEDANLFDEEDVFVMLIGVLEYKPGDKVTLDTGKTVEVTADTVDYMKRVLRLGLPYDLVANGSAEDVVAFLVRTTQEADAAEQAMKESFGDPEEILVQQPVSDVDNVQFDLDALTEDQRERLKLFALSHGGKD